MTDPAADRPIEPHRARHVVRDAHASDKKQKHRTALDARKREQKTRRIDAKQMRAVDEKPTRTMGELVDGNWWLWLTTWFAATLGNWFRMRLPRYTAAPNNAIYTMPDRCTIGVAADWGSGTVDSIRVSEMMRAQQPDITVHMGDVYFVGAPEEYERIFIGNPRGEQGSWPSGSHRPRADATALPAFAMCGNHEMMSGGYGFMRNAFKALGQKTSFFAIENAHWRIVALDTGYTTPRNLLTTFIFDRWLHVANSLPGPNLRWLREVVFKDPGDTRPVIFLSHHQPLSAYEEEYPRIAQQLAPWLDRAPLWFWGHEHRLTLYGKATVAGKAIRGRCVGHAGMPDVPDFTPPKAEWASTVVATPKQGRGIDDGHGNTFAYCGWLTFALDGPQFTVRYFEEDPSQNSVPMRPPAAPTMEETWTVNADGGCTGAISAFDTDSMQLMGTHTLDELIA